LKLIFLIGRVIASLLSVLYTSNYTIESSRGP
jgi:hypothetical protein